MLDLTQLNDSNYIMNNIFDIYILHKQLWKVIDSFKEQVKINGQSYEDSKWTIKYINSRKLVPTNWEALIKEYPIEQYRDIYDIRLSSKAGEIIMNDELVHYEPIESVRFNINDSIDEYKSNDTWEILDM